MTQDSVLQRDVTVGIENGLHLRPISLIAQLAVRFESEINVKKGQQSANARSTLDLMALGADQDSTLTLEISGSDAAMAMDELVALFESNFDGTEADA